MANQIGEALESLARSCASTAHLYRSLSLGAAPGAVRIDANSFRPEFEGLVREYSQPNMPRPAQPDRIFQHPAPQSQGSQNQQPAHQRPQPHQVPSAQNPVV